MFQSLMTIIVVLNSGVLAFSNPTHPKSNEFQFGLEMGFFSAYVLEMVLKILGFGFVSYRFSYLRDPWNWLDFFVIIATFASISGLVITSSSTKPIYFASLKIISPLRTIKSIPRLRLLIQAILDSLPVLYDMLKVILLVFGCFAILGVQLFPKVFTQKCVDLQSGKSVTTFDETSLCGGISTCSVTEVCARLGENPVSGLYSFDNILSAYLTVFIITTLEGWSQVQYYLILSTSWFSVLYVNTVAFVGAFILMNLALAIIVEKFTEMQNEKAANLDLNIRNLTSKITLNQVIVSCSGTSVNIILGIEGLTTVKGYLLQRCCFTTLRNIQRYPSTH
jgi:hypothetical protein